MQSSEIKNPENTSKKLNVTLRFLESKCLDYSLSDYAKNNHTPVELGNYQFELNLNLHVNEINKSINIIINITLYEKQGETLKQKLASLQSRFIFEIINFEELVIKIDETKFNVKDPLLDFVFSLSLSTTRGMFNIKLEDTIYANAILPIIDVVQLRNSNKDNVISN
jgi:hypothetical protein